MTMNTLADTMALGRAFRRRSLLVAAATLAAGAASAQTSVGVGLAGEAGDADGEGWFDAIPGERMRVQVASDATGGALTVLESIVAPGSATPLHVHDANEVFLILSGSLRLVRDGVGLDLDAGASTVVPRGIPHGFVNLADAAVRMVAIFAPGGMDAMFVELSRTPPDGWAEVAGRFGTVIVGPPVAG